MKYHIGIVREKQISGEILQNAFSGSHVFHPILYPGASALVEDFNLGLVYGLVFGMNKFTEKHLEFLASIKLKTPETPLIIVYKAVAPAVKAAVAKFQNTTVLAYPGEVHDMVGVFAKFSERQTVIPRNHVRYPARIQTELRWDGKVCGGILRNLSLGGACCEVYGRRLKNGERLLVHVPHFNMVADFKVQAEVMWTRELSQRKKQGSICQQVGLQFAA